MPELDPELCEIYPVDDGDEIDAIVRYIPVKERDAIADEDFAGPNRTFPIDTQ